MIRINLIAGERRGSPAAPTLEAGQKALLAGCLLLLVAAALIGWRYWSLGQHEAQLATGIEQARREEQRLAEVLKQVTEFETRRAQLQERVALIDELRRGQTAPVHLIDQVSRALPEMTWLTEMKQEGWDVTIEGRATSLAALSDFVGNLEATRYFRRPVEIVESEVVRGEDNGPELIAFVIKGTFHMAGLEPPAPAKPAAKAARGAKVG